MTNVPNCELIQAKTQRKEIKQIQARHKELIQARHKEKR